MNCQAVAFVALSSLGLLAACSKNGAPDAGKSSGAASASDAGADADASVELQRRIEELANPLVDPAGASGKAVGMVIGVAAANINTTLGLGATTLGGSVRPDENTVFEIGSVTKVYTGLLFGLELLRSHVPLEGLINPYFPAGAPKFGTRSINLLDLATHTSGLPDMPTNIHPAMPGNPAAGYTATDLAQFMKNYTLTVEPGKTFKYSNAGAGTLGYILVQETAVANYEALMKREIADRLGLPDTMITPNAEQMARSAVGYSNGKAAPANDIGEALRGSGALRSTAKDVLRFLRSSQGATDQEIAGAWQRALLPRRPSPYGTSGRTGFLINVEDVDGRTVYSKNGQTAGFSAQILFTTSPPIAIVLLANAHELVDTGALRTLGLKILSEIK